MVWQRRYYMKDEGIFGVDESPSRKPRIIAFIIVFFLLLVALGFALNYFLNSKAHKTQQVAVIPTLTIQPTQIPTDTPEATPSAGVSKTKSTPTPLVPTGSLSKSNPESGITVEVLNGSGIAGAAGKMAASLKSYGYTVSSTGNADAFTYTNVTIEVKKSEPKTLSLLKVDISKDYTVSSASAALTESNATDAIVIAGK